MAPHGSKKSHHQIDWTSVWLISYSGELCNKKLYRQDFQDLDHLKHALLHCWVRVITAQ